MGDGPRGQACGILPRRIKKSTGTILGTGAFYFRSLKLISLFALSALMTRFCQQLSVLVLPHFFTAFFDNTSQLITSNLNFLFECNFIL
jgi:hypothetical protein